MFDVALFLIPLYFNCEESCGHESGQHAGYKAAVLEAAAGCLSNVSASLIFCYFLGRRRLAVLWDFDMVSWK